MAISAESVTVAADGDIVALALAETGNDLGPAVDAAQYGRIVQCPESVIAKEAHAIARFLDDFTDCTRGLNETEGRARQARLASLGLHLVTLEACELFVHWAVVERELTMLERPNLRLPVAVISIDRSAAPSVQLRLPQTLACAADDLPEPH
jgi:hypothetical protein